MTATAARQCLRDLLECAWPTVLQTAGEPLEALSWRAAMSVSTDPAVIAAMTYEAFAAAVGVELARWGGRRRQHRILRAIHAAATTPGWVAAERAAALERAGFVVSDWQRALGEIDQVETRMVDCLDALELTELAASIPGVSPVGVAAILAQTGDPDRYDHARTWVKHAGLCPRDNESGAFAGTTTISRRGRPALRTAAWRAVWGALRHNPVYRARYEHLTSRANNPLRDGQARAAIAAALLGQLFIVITRRIAWDPDIAAGADHRPASTDPTETVAPMAA